MRELSLHILDIVQNSIEAGASLVCIEVIENPDEDSMAIVISDNGSGISAEQAQAALDPFVTSRTCRSVGLGLPLFRAASRQCGGDLEISSSPGHGTTVKATFVRSHIDRAPLGSMAHTFAALMVCNPTVDFVYNHVCGYSRFDIDTRKIKAEIYPVAANDPDVAAFVCEYIAEGERGLILDGTTAGHSH